MLSTHEAKHLNFYRAKVSAVGSTLERECKDIRWERRSKYRE
jgi:hypothetical protein